MLLSWYVEESWHMQGTLLAFRPWIDPSGPRVAGTWDGISAVPLEIDKSKFVLAIVANGKKAHKVWMSLE